jgi:hypothetical protein
MSIKPVEAPALLATFFSASAAIDRHLRRSDREAVVTTAPPPRALMDHAPWQKWDSDRAADLRRRGWRISDIAKAVGRSELATRDRLRSMGVHL